jgi:hypothetical protein
VEQRRTKFSIVKGKTTKNEKEERNLLRHGKKFALNSKNTKYVAATFKEQKIVEK